jgi:putative ABC transport system permease protein
MTTPSESPVETTGLSLGVVMIDSVLRHFVFGGRMLRRRPLFTLVALATLAIGVGSATAIFSIVDGVLLRPLAYREPGSLAMVWQTDTRFRDQSTLRRRWDRLWFTYPEYRRWSAEQRSFTEVAVYGTQQMALTDLGEPASVVVSTATPSLLPLLRVRPTVGRWFMPEEQGTGTERLAVLSYDLWASRFGGSCSPLGVCDTSALGRSVVLDGNRYRVVGHA